MEFSTQEPNRQPLYDLYALHPQHPNLTAWIAGVYKCYYSLADSLKPKAGMFWEYPDRPLDTNDRKTLLASDYIICNSPVTLQYLDSVNIPYAVIKTYKGSSYKIIRLYH